MRRVISEYGEQLLEKSPNNGCDALRQAISRYLARSRGIRVKTGRYSSAPARNISTD